MERKKYLDITGLLAKNFPVYFSDSYLGYRDYIKNP